jgi:hypothetical protein
LEGETYQALVRRRIEENERAFAVAVEEGEQTRLTGTVDGVNGSAFLAGA